MPLLCWPGMAGGDRMRRIDEVMRKIVGTAIANDLEDPRIGFVTVTAVQTSPDLRSARVYVSVLGDEEEREATLAALRSSHGKLQAAIAREVRIKHTPTLTFHYDEGPERGIRLTRLLEGDE
jgi:ribosome-binding factor A